jgi:hypothetical protein
VSRTEQVYQKLPSSNLAHQNVESFQLDFLQ